jgi:putative membrane protein
MKSFFQRWIITTVAVLVAAHIVPGIKYDNVAGLLVATLVLGLLNAFVRPIMMLLSFPLVILTLGFFILVINALLLYLVGQMKSFHVESFWSALFGALIISVVSLVLNSMTGTGDSRVQVKRGRAEPPPPPRRDDGGGPVIDV